MKTAPSGKPFHPPNRETSEVGFGPKMPLGFYKLHLLLIKL